MHAVMVVLLSFLALVLVAIVTVGGIAQASPARPLPDLDHGLFPAPTPVIAGLSAPLLFHSTVLPYTVMNPWHNSPVVTGADAYDEFASPDGRSKLTIMAPRNLLGTTSADITTALKHVESSAGVPIHPQRPVTVLGKPRDLWLYDVAGVTTVLCAFASHERLWMMELDTPTDHLKETLPIMRTMLRSLTFSHLH